MTETTTTRDEARTALLQTLDKFRKGHASAREVAAARRAYEAAKNRDDVFQERLDAARKMVR